MAKTDTKLTTEWDFTPLLGDTSETSLREHEDEVRKAAHDFVKKWKGRTDYLESVDSLKEALDDYERWARFYGTGGKVGFYLSLQRIKNQSDAAINAEYNKIEEVSKKISNDIQFFTLNLGKIKPELQKKFLADATLAKYKHYLGNVFTQARHMLSDEEEKIMTLLSTNAYSRWMEMVEKLISQAEREVLTESGKREKKPFEEILNLISSKDKAVRDDAAAQVNNILAGLTDVAEAELNALLSYQKINDELRHFERPDASRHLSDDIESATVDVLLSTVSKRFDLSQKFYAFKAQLMGVEKLEYHERNVEYGKLQTKYPYDTAVKLVQAVFKKLDRKFAEIFKEYVTDGRLDVYPAVGKGGGAFCAPSLISSPVYVLLNHVDKLNDVRTIAHEMGHAINFELSRVKQNALNYGTCLATAEVASTFMEDFVIEELMQEASEEERLSIMIIKLETDIATIMRQTACYNFERELHDTYRKKGYLSKDEIGSIFQKHMASYMGPAVKQSPGSQNWWIYWSHIRNYFYVYSYVSGLLISKALQSEVQKDPAFVEKVKDFLAAGESDSPKNLFAKLGIDITTEAFWNEGLDRVESLFDETQKLAKKLGKL